MRNLFTVLLDVFPQIFKFLHTSAFHYLGKTFNIFIIKSENCSTLISLQMTFVQPPRLQTERREPLLLSKIKFLMGGEGKKNCKKGWFVSKGPNVILNSRTYSLS